MSEAWIVRHAQTEWSVAHRHTGRTDVPLTDAGREDARALGPRLAGAAFDAVWTSPLSRARETATLAGFPDAAGRDELLEWDYGDYEGITTDEVRRDRPGWLLWRDGCPNGETAADVGRRMDPVVEELARLTDPAGQDGRVLVFAHAHLLRVLTARWLELAPAEGARLPLETASVSVLGHERGLRALHVWNSRQAQTPK